MTTKQWTQLHEALNAPESLVVLSKEAVDQDDRNMREGLAILQLLVMVKVPAALKGTWSPLLGKIATGQDTATAIAEWLLAPISKGKLQEETHGLLAAHVCYIMPSTVWCLSHELFKLTKSQQ